MENDRHTGTCTMNWLDSKPRSTNFIILIIRMPYPVNTQDVCNCTYSTRGISDRWFRHESYAINDGPSVTLGFSALKVKWETPYWKNNEFILKTMKNKSSLLSFDLSSPSTTDDPWCQIQSLLLSLCPLICLLQSHYLIYDNFSTHITFFRNSLSG